MYKKFAAAYVRGMAIAGKCDMPSSLMEIGLEELDEAGLEAAVLAGRLAGLKMHYFKNSLDPLPRVKRVLGFLQSIEFESLLDVGSGRGAFLWPCLDAFPQLQVTSVDLLDYRTFLIDTVRIGGIGNLKAETGDICAFDKPDKSFDIVSILEVLEHIPGVYAAICTAVRLARKYVVASVPSKPDGNPGHIHFLARENLIELFSNAGVSKLQFDNDHGHLIIFATVGNKSHE
ncbi:MAG: class I SAM-dependent methyltransferase [Eubacteriaceae bacterium]|nr:class I SAM-dependent methyltransferase [Eubacteriaceae bacterium]